MKTPRGYTSKQIGDACEMLVAGELTLAGVPALKMSDNWPCYDVIAQRKGGGPSKRISVKSRTFKKENTGTSMISKSQEESEVSWRLEEWDLEAEMGRLS